MMANNQKSAAMQIPLWWIYLSFPVGGGVMTFRFVLKVMDSLKELIGKGGTQA